MTRTGPPPARPTSGAARPVAPPLDSTWCLVEEGFDLAREHEIESLFAVANGYLGTRGSLAEGSSLSSPATFIAGIFDRGSGPEAIPELASAPDWMRLRAVVDGNELRVEDGDILEHRRVLDLRRGILWREWRHRDPCGRIVRLRGFRLASLADRHVLVQSVEFTPENFSGRLLIETRIETGGPEPASSTPAPPRLVPKAGSATATPDGATSLALRTPGTGHVVAFATASTLRGADAERFERAVQAHERQLVERWHGEADIGSSYRLDRLVTVHTSRDAARPAEAARAHLARLLSGGQGLDRVTADHVAAWQERWRSTDVEIEGDDDAQRALRFACYHLISAADPEDEHVSIGARGLTGPAYKGHVFWDTEIYMLPFFIFTHPPAARALLMYRYHTLPAAREKAKALGWAGALYAWESADTGEEATPSSVLAPDGRVIPIRNGEQENHISADVAYGVWQYWHATGDDDFFRNAGAEILLETARFWAGRGDFGSDGLYHIRRVIGPDEYHEDVDDSAYTNVMAQWNLERGAETASLLEARWPRHWRELADRIGLDPEEPARWAEIASAMYTGFDTETGLFEQFKGYFELDEVDMSDYEPRTAPVDVLLGYDRIRRTRVIKQADVVLLLHLLWDRFPPEAREANFRFYEPRCGHGSSLSPSIHALVAARLGDDELAGRYFRQAAEIDLANNMGNAAGGVHAAALGGLWQAVVFGFGGLRFGAGGPYLDPRLPPGWRALELPIHWRGRTVRLSTAREPGREVQR